MPEIKIVNPDALGKPLGQYSHLTRVKASEFVFIAGQVGVDKAGKIIGDDFDAQCVQIFANIETALKSVGAGWGNIVQFTTYLVHSQDIAEIHGLPAARIPQDVRQRRLSAQHAADDRPARAGAAPGRGTGSGGTVAVALIAVFLSSRGGVLKGRVHTRIRRSALFARCRIRLVPDETKKTAPWHSACEAGNSIEFSSAAHA